MGKNNIKAAFAAYAPTKNMSALILAVSGFLLIFLSFKGIGISADSITYTSVSRNLNAHGNLQTFDGDSMVDFPLGYPLFLSAIQFLTRQDPFVFGLLLNSLLFATLIYVLICLLKDAGLPPLERYLCGAALVLSPALLEVYQMLWSETVFILCFALFLAAAVQYGKTQRMGWLWTMAVIAAIGCVTRYAGLTLVATGGLVILGDRSLPLGKRWWRSVLFGAMGISLMIGNLVRNWAIAGSTTGDRKKNFLPLSIHLHRFGEVLCSWMPPLNKYPSLYIPCAVVFMLVVLGACAFFWIRRKETLSLFAVCKTFCVVYALFIIATALLTEYEGLDVRLLSPLYIPALIGLTGAAYHLFGPGRPDQRLARGRASGPETAARLARGRASGPETAARLGRYIVVLALTGLVIANGCLDADYIAHPDMAVRRYIRYDIDGLRHSPTLHFINTHATLFTPDVSVYSNAPDLMYLLSARKHADYLPDLRLPTDIENFKSDSSSYLIWLNACHAYPSTYPEEMRRHTDLTLVYSFADGAIFFHK